MRRAAFQINGEWVEGYFDRRKFEVGEMYEMRNSLKLMVVEQVFDGEFEIREDGVGWFYRLRPATQEEIAAWNADADTSEDEKEIFKKFFQRTEFF